MVKLDRRSSDRASRGIPRSRSHARVLVAASWFAFIAGAALAGLDPPVPRAIGLAAWAVALLSMAWGSFRLLRLGRAR